MPNGVARSQDFYEGSESARQPNFRSMQQGAGGGYRRTSTLDNLLPSGNGMAEPDKQRALYGVQHSAVGQSEATFDKSLWLTGGARTESLYNKTFG